MYYDMREIIPDLQGVYRYNKADESVSRFTSREVEVRALIEGQFIAKRVYAEKLGFNTGKKYVYSIPARIFSLKYW